MIEVSLTSMNSIVHNVLAHFWPLLLQSGQGSICYMRYLLFTIVSILLCGLAKISLPMSLSHTLSPHILYTHTYSYKLSHFPAILRKKKKLFIRVSYSMIWHQSYKLFVLALAKTICRVKLNCADCVVSNFIIVENEMTNFLAPLICAIHCS